MKKIRAICFTPSGKVLLKKLEASINMYDEYEITSYCKMNGELKELTLTEWASEGFAKGEALLFVSAMGIAIRAIAPLVMDKLVDEPVLVMDDLGNHVIPVLSGHVGGANEIALFIGSQLGSEPVITTATDNHEAFSVDLFAKENHLTIQNRDGIKNVSAKALEGKPITLSIKNYPPKEKVDVLITDDIDVKVTDRKDNAGLDATIILCPKPYVIGIGCKRGKTYEEIWQSLSELLAKYQIETNQIYAIATIDRKEKEPGIVQLSRKLRLPIISFDAEMLGSLQGDFSASEFVAQTMGVDNVCERASLLAAGKDGKLICPKTACTGITFAIARRKPM